MRDALTVGQVNLRVKSLIEDDAPLQNLWVRGELSAYKIYPSGHHYFSLKDESGVLRCVMFKGDAGRLGFAPANGTRVIAGGRVSVYTRDGQYQLYCQSLTPDGIGALTLAFEELKQRLETEGLFDPRHKKPLPPIPKRIVLVTSPAGAAVRDMIRILGRRWPLAKVIVAPVRVQGTEAPGEIAGVLRFVNKHNLGDLIITGRGGGSPEDLWAFNDEQVARAIFASVIPVISAVGHEPDVTIADFTADVRAATPSHAAEIAVPDGRALRSDLEDMHPRLCAALRNRLRVAESRLQPLTRRLDEPERFFAGHKQRLDRLTEGLHRAGKNVFDPRRQAAAQLAGRLDALSPLKVLARGYAVATDEEGRGLYDAKQVKIGQKIRLRLQNGTIITKAEAVE